MSPLRSALPLLLVAALAAAQDQAPLAESKQQLQSLKKDQAAQRAKADEGLRLRDSLPGLNVPTAEPSAPAPPAAQQGEREREGKSDAEARNWLVDGYDRLDRRGRGGRGAAETEDETPLDPRDPDYFLRVYGRQRAAAEGRRERGREGRDGAAAGSATATMEPFLRNWLSGSPVEGVLRDTLGARRTGGAPGFDLSDRGDTGGARPDDPAAWNRDRTAGSAPAAGRFDGPSATATAVATNPYLAALGLDRGSGAAAAAPASVPPPPIAPAAAAAWTPPDLPKAEPRRAPVRPEDEAKKYFPQLRKF